MELLKLAALDRDDLEVISTHLQDATVSVADVHWRPAEKRLVMSLARFDWAGSLDESAQFQRRRTALRFDRVNAIKCRNVDCKNRRAMFNLLAVEFDESDPPGGVVTLIFSGGAALPLLARHRRACPGDFAFQGTEQERSRRPGQAMAAYTTAFSFALLYNM